MRILLLHIEIFVTVAAVCVVTPYLVGILKLLLVDLSQSSLSLTVTMYLNTCWAS